MGDFNVADAWDVYCELLAEDPRRDEVYKWVIGQIETTRASTDGCWETTRHHFLSVEDGGLFPDDPDEIAEEITNLLLRHPVLIEVIAILEKNNC